MLTSMFSISFLIMIRQVFVFRVYLISALGDLDIALFDKGICKYIYDKLGKFLTEKQDLHPADVKNR